MLIHDRLRDLIQSSLPLSKITPSGWRKANCPVCVHRGHRPDQRQRFGWFNQNTSMGMNCFNCGFSAKWEQGQEIGPAIVEFLKAVGVDQNQIQALKFDAYVQAHKMVGQHTRAQPVDQFLKTWQPAQLPPDSFSLEWWATQGLTDPDFLQATNYALQRGIENLDQVYWSPHKKDMINKRLILPYHYNNQVVGWGARLAQNQARGIRYYQQAPQHFVYGLDAQRKPHRQWTIVVEGVFDALITDGVAVLHNQISDQQAWLLKTLNTNIVVCADRDSSGDQLVWDAIKHGWWVSFPPWEPNIKDANQAAQKYGKLFVVESILSHCTQDAAKIKIWRKLDLGN